MGFFERLDMELQKDLIDFVKTEEERKGKTLGDAIKADVLKKLIDGDCKITGSATNHKKKKMYVEFTFYGGETDDDRDAAVQLKKPQKGSKMTE